MASVSGICSPSSTLKPKNFSTNKTPTLLRKESIAFPSWSKLTDRTQSPLITQSIAREISTDLSSSKNDGGVLKKEKKGLVKDARELWQRYVDWLYQHKELGLYLDVSRIGFTDEFLEEMEPMLQKAFEDMKELEKGAIANPDEGRMVGHYWLRNPKLAPNSFLRLQIENTLEAVCKFADDVISGKIKPPSSPEGRFTQILSVGIGGSALGPQFVAEALAPDNPPLKIRFIDNTDPGGIDHQIAQLGAELASTLVIVISKSGGTPETRNGLLEVQKAFREAGLDFAKQEKSPLQDVGLRLNPQFLSCAKELEKEVSVLNGIVLTLRGDEGRLRSEVLEMEKSNAEFVKKQERMSVELNVLQEQKKKNENNIEILLEEKTLTTRSLEECKKELEGQKRLNEVIVLEKNEIEELKAKRESEIVELVHCCSQT